MNSICVNENCTEFDLVKSGVGEDPNMPVICGRCGEPCETTDREWIDPNADPAN